MLRCVLLLALNCLYVVSVTQSHAQELRVLSTSAVSSGAPHEWYSVEADPENASNLIACGMMWDAKDNANYGFVYSSLDAGKSWRLALEDKHSRWVSEESCAYGSKGVAYFVAGASKVAEDGGLHHEYGTTHIWVSRDSGRSWSLGAFTGWTDFSTSIVNRDRGPDQNRLYIFFNGLRNFYSSIGDKVSYENMPPAPTDALGVMGFKDGERRVTGPFAYAEMYDQGYRGAHPVQNVRLKDGSILTFFWTEKTAFDRDNKENGVEYVFGAQRTTLDFKRNSGPAVISRHVRRFDEGDDPCRSYNAAYSPMDDAVYAAYLDESDRGCRLILAKSLDGGQTWSDHSWTEKPGAQVTHNELAKNEYASLAMARNEDGVMALLWRPAANSNCWRFAVSTDDGGTYSHPLQISPCSKETEGEHRLNGANLSFYAEQAEAKSEDSAFIRVTNLGNRGVSHVSGIAVSPDGVFHPVWITSTNGDVQLRTAAIAVRKAQNRNVSAAMQIGGWRYATNTVTFLFGGSQYYDAAKNTLRESVILCNSGSKTVSAPLRLEIDPSSRLGLIYPLNVTMEGSGQAIGQYLDISQYIPADGLRPGASSASIPLTFHFEPYSDVNPPDASVALVSLRLLARIAN